MSDKVFTKYMADGLIAFRGLFDWGIKTENLDRDQLTFEIVSRTPSLRKEAVKKLKDAGLSNRETAKVLGVDESTVRADVRENPAESAGKSRTPATNKPETKERRAKIAEEASAQGVTSAPSEKYRIIYADPPWDYGAHQQPDYHTEQRDHYPTMSLDEICAMPVKDWTEDDAVLFLWVTSPMLRKSFDVIDAWGFEYKTSFVWDKIKHNMGHYNSVRHEFLLVCTKGACRPDVKKLFDSVVRWDRSEHSVKPIEFYHIIETIYTHGRRLEMFARSNRAGWEAYGHVQQISGNGKISGQAEARL